MLISRSYLQVTTNSVISSLYVPYIRTRQYTALPKEHCIMYFLHSMNRWDSWFSQWTMLDWYCASHVQFTAHTTSDLLKLCGSTPFGTVSHSFYCRRSIIHHVYASNMLQKRSRTINSWLIVRWFIVWKFDWVLVNTAFLVRLSKSPMIYGLHFMLFSEQYWSPVKHNTSFALILIAGILQNHHWKLNKLNHQRSNTHIRVTWY